MVAEYLNRSDTAVIYPEPVSDREEGAEEGVEEGDEDNDNGEGIHGDNELGGGGCRGLSQVGTGRREGAMEMVRRICIEIMQLNLG